MASIARLQIEHDGKRYIRRVQLLGATTRGAMTTPCSTTASLRTARDHP